MLKTERSVDDAPPVNDCSAVQTLTAERREEPLTMQAPNIEKHPAVRLMPFAKVDDAVRDETLRRLVARPPVNVEVADDVAVM